MKIPAILLFLSVTAIAQEFEEPPVLSASSILKPEFAVGVRDAVPTYAGRNAYVIASDVGTFEAEGNAMLVRRVREVAAIRELQEVSRSAAYRGALKAAAKSPVLVAKGLIEHPVSTVTGVPKGMWKVLNRAGQNVKERTEHRERSAYEDSSAAELIGFSKAKRDVALQLGVDPYSSNPILQRELNGLAWAAYAGKLTFTLATAPIGGGAGMALTATGVTDTFEKAIRDQSPTDLRLASLKRLLAIGVGQADADSFLNNPAFSPSVQTALVLHLEALQGVANRPSFIRLADANSTTEADALFFSETLRLFSDLHANGRPLGRLGSLGNLPVALAADQTAIMALEWDYASWTPMAANFIAGLKAGDFGVKISGYLVAISGEASPMVKERLQAMGVTLATRLTPGPLKP
jgi:hypothetical protein